MKYQIIKEKEITFEEAFDALLSGESKVIYRDRIEISKAPGERMIEVVEVSSNHNKIISNFFYQFQYNTAEEIKNNTQLFDFNNKFYAGYIIKK